MPKVKDISNQQRWTSPIPEERWKGFRRVHRGLEAFKSLPQFEEAQISELENSLEEHERQALGRLLARGKKTEIEIFIRTHGANPISDPQAEVNVAVGVAKADVVNLSKEPSERANAAFLNGEVVYVLFQAGEASRFNRGPLFNLNPVEVAKELAEEGQGFPDLKKIESLKGSLPSKVADFLAEGPLGPKQPLLIRAALRRILQDEIRSGRLTPDKASDKYREALNNQKILFFIGQKGGVGKAHDKALRETFKFYGFNPQNMVTVEQELVRGLTANDLGEISLMEDERATDAVGHLYAFLQAVRPGGFTTYTESGRPIRPMEMEALAHLASRGGKYLSIIRINDMDRLSTEIANAKALSYALSKFDEGYVNVIEGVANPGGQKGGTGTTFGNPEVHILTETHENSYPALSRAFEQAMKEYLEKNNGRHPAYNAMRQWADLQATRSVLREFGARIVFVPRQKNFGETRLNYIGVDMPMGDLSLFVGHYKSRMFQFSGPQGKELLIHDMKKKENLPVTLRTIARQMEDPFVVAAAKELILSEEVPFPRDLPPQPLYGAPAPEFE